MKIPEKIAADLQHFLYLTTLDDCCPDEFLGGRAAVKPDNAHELWGNCVELIYRCLACDLLRISMGWNEMDDPTGLAKALAQHDPFDIEDFNGHGAKYWIAPHLYATRKTRELLNRHGVVDLDSGLNESFVNSVSEIFEKHKTPWGSNFIFI